MCGIVGVTGPEPALPILLEGLARLEYRGYDSAGVALQRDDSIWRCRRVGKLAALAAAVSDAPSAPPPTAGIGHTRWATHGAPSDRNAHPHVDCTGQLALIHNGIVENYRDLQASLPPHHSLSSETDTEVLVHLIEDALAAGATLAAAVREVLGRIEGSFAIVAIHAGEPGVLVAARRGAPLIAGRTDGSGMVASDIPALLARTREVYVIEDDHVVELRSGSMVVTNREGTEVSPARRHIPWDLETAEKEGYPDFMAKEIHEQPRALRDTLRDRHRGARLALDEMRLSDAQLQQVDKVFVVGCGSSYYSGLVGKYAIEHWARLPAEIDIASEFRYRDPVLGPTTLVVAISQSGETTDTREAVAFARREKAPVLTVSNVVDSQLARDADAVLYTRAGPEVCVASTKCHTTQVMAMHLLALYLAQVRGQLYPDEVTRLVEALGRVPDLVATVLTRVDELSAVAHRYAGSRDFFFLGRGVGYPVALEGALKLKEISYLRAEGYPAGEMKHGPIALIEPGAVVVAVATRGRLHAKVMSNIEEMRSRGATIIAVANDGDEQTATIADDVLWVPPMEPGAELFSPAVEVVALQVFAYAIAKSLGRDVDQPRNLAKTVTVE